ncbi:MAG: DUF2089 domain-containing protein [Dysgonamonadaceae bacterium]|jgi:hypothetical protein|nr:DUF2089 domain-containing protein [Dysgonamonadaceae bacterium]
MLPSKCPSCNNALKVKALYCPKCRTEVSGLYELPVFVQLTEEEQQFLLDFVKFSGSIKEMAAKMHKSYPFVRNFLDEIIEKIKKYEQNESI